MSETQDTISEWANQTFGSVRSNARVAARANEEMAELLRKLTADDNHAGAAEEIADVVIESKRHPIRYRSGVESDDAKRRLKCLKNLWRERRGSNPRPLA